MPLHAMESRPRLAISKASSSGDENMNLISSLICHGPEIRWHVRVVAEFHISFATCTSGVDLLILDDSRSRTNISSTVGRPIMLSVPTTAVHLNVLKSADL